MRARHRYREENQESQGQEAQGARAQRPKTPVRGGFSYQGREASLALGRLRVPRAAVQDRPHLRPVCLVSSPITSPQTAFIISLYHYITFLTCRCRLPAPHRLW